MSCWDARGTPAASNRARPSVRGMCRAVLQAATAAAAEIRTSTTTRAEAAPAPVRRLKIVAIAVRSGAVARSAGGGSGGVAAACKDDDDEDDEEEESAPFAVVARRAALSPMRRSAVARSRWRQRRTKAGMAATIRAASSLESPPSLTKSRALHLSSGGMSARRARRCMLLPRSPRRSGEPRLKGACAAAALAPSTCAGRVFP